MRTIVFLFDSNHHTHPIMFFQVYQLKQDAVFYRKHFTACRQASLRTEHRSQSRSVYAELSDEDSEDDKLSDEEDEDAGFESFLIIKKSLKTLLISFVDFVIFIENTSTTSSSMLNEFSILFDRTKKFKGSLAPSQNLFGVFASRVIPPLLSKLERWDIYEIDQYKVMSTEKNFKFKLNKFLRKIEVSSHDSMRYSLFRYRFIFVFTTRFSFQPYPFFSLRLEILNAIQKILLSLSSRTIQASKFNLIEMTEFFSSELMDSVKRGISIVALNAYLALLGVLVNHLKVIVVDADICETLLSGTESDSLSSAWQSRVTNSLLNVLGTP